MRHVDLPTWLKGALPVTRHGYYVEFDEHDVSRILKARHTISKVDGLRFMVAAWIPWHCWSCGGSYQHGVLTQNTTWDEVPTTRHVRRRGCSFRAYSESYTGSYSFSPAVQTSARLPVTIKLTAE